MGATLLAGKLVAQQPGFNLPNNTLRRLSTLTVKKQESEVDGNLDP